MGERTGGRGDDGASRELLTESAFFDSMQPIYDLIGVGTMKSLGIKEPWWVGEQADCQHCGRSYELELKDGDEEITNEAGEVTSRRVSPMVGSDLFARPAVAVVCPNCQNPVIVHKPDLPRRLTRDDTLSAETLTVGQRERLNKLLKLEPYPSLDNPTNDDF